MTARNVDYSTSNQSLLTADFPMYTECIQVMYRETGCAVVLVESLSISHLHMPSVDPSQKRKVDLTIYRPDTVKLVLTYVKCRHNGLFQHVTSSMILDEALVVASKINDFCAIILLSEIVAQATSGAEAVVKLKWALIYKLTYLSQILDCRICEQFQRISVIAHLNLIDVADWETWLKSEKHVGQNISPGSETHRDSGGSIYDISEYNILHIVLEWIKYHRPHLHKDTIKRAISCIRPILLHIENAASLVPKWVFSLENTFWKGLKQAENDLKDVFKVHLLDEKHGIRNPKYHIACLGKCTNPESLASVARKHNVARVANPLIFRNLTLLREMDRRHRNESVRYIEMPQTVKLTMGGTRFATYNKDSVFIVTADVVKNKLRCYLYNSLSNTIVTLPKPKYFKGSMFDVSLVGDTLCISSAGVDGQICLEYARISKNLRNIKWHQISSLPVLIHGLGDCQLVSCAYDNELCLIVMHSDNTMDLIFYSTDLKSYRHLQPKPHHEDIVIPDTHTDVSSGLIPRQLVGFPEASSVVVMFDKFLCGVDLNSDTFRKQIFSIETCTALMPVADLIYRINVKEVSQGSVDPLFCKESGRIDSLCFVHARDSGKSSCDSFIAVTPLLNAEFRRMGNTMAYVPDDCIFCPLRLTGTAIWKKSNDSK